MIEPVLSVRDLKVDFVTRHSVLNVLDGVSFDIARGETLGIVGESGAGKTMAGLAVIGLIDPPGRMSGGEVHLCGERIDALPEWMLRPLRGKRIGMIFQDPLASLNPYYRIGDQLVTTIRTHLNVSAREARERAIALLADVGIAAPQERARAFPHQFSGGMRQRVALALALCAEPELLIADEPTTALDVSVQAQIMELLQRLCRERGMAIMLIAHDLAVIAGYADRIAVFYAGRVVEVGPVRAIVQMPRHPYTQGLMEAIPPLHGDVARLARIPGSVPRLGEIPTGCPFNPRCPKVFSICRDIRPDLRGESERLTACHLYDARFARPGEPHGQ